MRRKLAGLVLLLGAIFVGQHLLRAREKVVPVEIRYVLGEGPAVKRLEAIFREEGSGEEVARFATELIAPEVVQKTRLPGRPLTVEIRLDGGSPVTRALEPRRDAVIRLELGGDGR